MSWQHSSHKPCQNHAQTVLLQSNLSYELLEMTFHMQSALITMGFKEEGRENGGTILDAHIRLGEELPGWFKHSPT